MRNEKFAAGIKLGRPVLLEVLFVRKMRWIEMLGWEKGLLEMR